MLAPPSLTSFIVMVLAGWRVTHLLWAEDGPGDVFVRLRSFAGSTFAGRLLDCFYCLSLWVAAPLAWALGGGWRDRVVLWLGLSGGAILLERATAPRQVLPPPAAWEEKQIKTAKDH